jgi:hypothetical protein
METERSLRKQETERSLKKSKTNNVSSKVEESKSPQRKYFDN